MLSVLHLFVPPSRSSRDIRKVRRRNNRFALAGHGDVLSASSKFNAGHMPQRHTRLRAWPRDIRTDSRGQCWSESTDRIERDDARARRYYCESEERGKGLLFVSWQGGDGLPKFIFGTGSAAINGIAKYVCGAATRVRG